MVKLSKPHKNQPEFSWDVESPQKTARLRMVQLPIDESRDITKQVIFPREELWVPVSVVNGNIHILPGVPRLCKLLRRLTFPCLKLTVVNSRESTGWLEAVCRKQTCRPRGQGNDQNYHFYAYARECCRRIPD